MAIIFVVIITIKINDVIICIYIYGINYNFYYLCSMHKKFKIYQKSICVDANNMENHMILIFTEDDKVTGISIFAYPKLFEFHNSDYQHYPICQN
jgi:hypothetical protein